MSSLGDWAGACIRWGRDGFAIAGAGDQFTESDRLYIVRWSQADQSGADTDGNGIDDVWERTHFFRLGINPDGDEDGDGLANALEYLMLTDPRARSVASVAVGLSGESPRVLRLVYDRRRGIPASAFEYESSTDLGNWQPATGVAEKVLSTGILRGEPAESIEVLIPWDEEADQSFTRIRWKRP